MGEETHVSGLVFQKLRDLATHRRDAVVTVRPGAPPASFGPYHTLGQYHGDQALAPRLTAHPRGGSQSPHVEARGTASLPSSVELCPPTAPS